MQLPNPARYTQGTMSRCWAAAIASILDATGSPCRSVDFVIDHARRKGCVVDGGGALRSNPPTYQGWIDAVQLFDMNFLRFYRADTAEPGKPTLSLEYFREKLEQKKYILLSYKNPEWAKYDGGEAWHVVVVYGVDLEFKYLSVMNPDKGKLETHDLEPTFDYFTSEKAMGTPWSP